MILDGELDHIPEQMFYMAGGIDDVVQQYEAAEREGAGAA
jgi:F0F1-type ATP synthase beta subunit